MSKRQFLYLPVWKKYREEIETSISLGVGQGFTIPSRFFKAAGNRITYRFKLEIKNGKVINDISGSAVARDLAFLLLDNVEDKKHLRKNHFFVRMSDNFYVEVFPVKMYKDIQSDKLN